MFKIKNLIAGCLAAIMLLTVGVCAAETVAYGDYTVEVSYLKTGSSDTSSMADYMASTTIPVTVDENGYTVTMDFYNYYKTTGSTALRNLKYDVDGTWVDLSLDDVSDEYSGYANSSYYKRTVVTVDSLDDLLLQAYIIPMGTLMPAYATQSWRMVFDLDTLTRVATVSTQGMEISASVAKNIATSTVIIPETTDMGELSKIDDTVVSYDVEIDAGYGQTVTVTVDDELVLTAGDASLTVANDFDGQHGTLTVSAEDVAQVASYEGELSFAGALSFSIVVE